ncbi:MAG: DnaA N-terminal domain-containing protein [Terriglobia bacterium]
MPSAPSELNPWQRILAEVQRQVNPESYRTWLRPTRFDSQQNGTIKVQVPTREFQDWIHEKFEQELLAAASRLSIASKIEFVCPERPEPAAPSAPGVKPAKLPDLALGRAAPVIPEICWRGLFAQYRELAVKESESPEAFHFAGIAVAVSAALGKSVCLQEPVEVVPNLFLCIVGEANCGKSDPERIGIQTVLRAAVPEAMTLNSLDSAQGLISAIKRRGARAPSAVITLSEIRSLIEKSAQKSSGDIIPKLNDLYDCRRLEINTRHSFEEVDSPPPGVFLAATTPEWMEKAKREDLTGGTGSRILFFPADPRRGVRPTRQDFKPVIVALKEIVEFWKARAPAELKWDPPAFELYWKWHDQRPSLDCTHRLIQTMSVRHRSYVLKFAILYAAIEKAEKISEAHIKAALALVNEFAFPSLWHLFADFSMSPWGKLEQKYIDVVKAAHPHPVRVKDLLDRFNNTQFTTNGRWMLRRALDNVAGRIVDDPSWDGELKIVTLGRKHFVILNED